MSSEDILNDLIDRFKTKIYINNIHTYITIISIILIIFSFNNSGYNYLSIKKIYTDVIQYLYKTNDNDLYTEGINEVVKILENDLSESNYIYTMNNEGGWYYILKKSPPSRFYAPYLSHTRAHQKEVITELKQKLPKIIIFESDGYWNRMNNISTFNTTPLIAQYILRNYRPYKIIGEFWIWKYYDNFYKFNTNRIGNINSLPKFPQKRESFYVTGNIKDSNDRYKYSTLFVTIGSERTPIWAGRLYKYSRIYENRIDFTIELPILNLPENTFKFEVWVVSKPEYVLKLLGDIKVNIGKDTIK